MIDQKNFFRDVFVFKPTLHTDDRGYFAEMSKQSALNSLGIDEYFSQVNFSYTKIAGTLRGLHTQVGDFAQSKLLTVLGGKILDVVVNIDLRSEFFGQWASIVLEGERLSSIYIPKHYLHGFVTLTGNCRIVYQCSREYSHQNERSVRFDDQILNIDWGIPNSGIKVSDKDKKGTSFERLAEELRSNLVSS